ncbi:MAG TPA: hypothetical protein VEI97_17140, partial [bacterium]|nr:hypothetical protein [bacterium]
ALVATTLPYWVYFRNIGTDDLNFLEVYFIPAHMILLALGVTGLAPNPRGPRVALMTWQGAVVAVLVLGLLVKEWGAMTPGLSRQQSEIGSRFAVDTLLSVPDHSILICEGDEIFLYWYLQAVAGLKPDVAILESDILTNTGTWYWADLRRRHPDLQYPPSPSAVEMAEKGLETKQQVQAYMTRLLARRNPDRGVFLTGLQFNPSNNEDIGIALAGLLYQVRRGEEFALDPAEAFFEQRLDPPQLAWLIDQEGFDFYEVILREKYIRTLAAYAERALASGQLELGERLFSFTAELEPARWDLLRGLAISVLDREQWTDAKHLFGQLAKHDPNDPLYAFGLAVAHYHLGDMEQWRLEVARAHALDPENKFLELEAQTLEGIRDRDRMVDLFTAPDSETEE